jgi:hypothetical protein
VKFAPIHLRGNWTPRLAPKYRRKPHRVTRADMIPVEAEYAMTAGTVIDDPRQPRIMATGVYDSRGKMILRVSIPITQSMGFGVREEPFEDDCVHELVPEDMLMITDMHGHGVAFVDHSQVQDEDDYDDAW